MFDFPEMVPPRQAAAAARLVCAALGCEMLAACDTLGGLPAVRRLIRFLDGLRDDALSDRAVGRELNWLRSLLALEFVDDFESEEAARFFELDPASEQVAGLCQLHDVIHDLVARLPGSPAPAGAHA